ncbi:MAG: glycosyltransferase [Oligoflexales bacterium]|nr:glycosyltransferase [Oligoflexales bacterium]
MSRGLVFTATYNEAENIEKLVDSIMRAISSFDVLVVDDNSSDDTGAILDRIAKQKRGRLTVIHRPWKLGLGTAHKIAFKYALHHEYEYLITMDADFSHDPLYLPLMREKLEHSEFVIGSRYVKYGRCNYGAIRRWFSKGANILARNLLAIPLRECTTSFRGFRLSLLRKLPVDRIKSEGYSFFFETLFYVSKFANRMDEFPIFFEDRRAGQSKISKKEIIRAVSNLFKLFTIRIIYGRRSDEDNVTSWIYPPCGICNSPYHTVINERVSLSHSHEKCDFLSIGPNYRERIVKCLHCGLISVNPQAKKENVRLSTSHQEDLIDVENRKSLTMALYRNFRTISHLFKKNGRLLDFGSQCGAFISIAKQNGYSATGVESFDNTAGSQREMLDFDIHCSALETLDNSNGDFDIVTCWNAIEYSRNPLQEILHVNARLRTGGVFAFSTLNSKNWFLEFCIKKIPSVLDKKITFFDDNIIAFMLENTGFRLINASNYINVVDLNYVLRLLKELGIPGMEYVGYLINKTKLKKVRLPLNFGDIRLYLAEKVENAVVFKTSQRVGASKTEWYINDKTHLEKKEKYSEKSLSLNENIL